MLWCENNVQNANITKNLLKLWSNKLTLSKSIRAGSVFEGLDISWECNCKKKYILQASITKTLWHNSITKTVSSSGCIKPKIVNFEWLVVICYGCIYKKSFEWCINRNWNIIFSSFKVFLLKRRTTVIMPFSFTHICHLLNKWKRNFKIIHACHRPRRDILHE